MANVVEELQQQHQPQHHQSRKRVRWSEELTQVRDIRPEIQGLTILVHEILKTAQSPKVNFLVLLTGKPNPLLT